MSGVSFLGGHTMNQLIQAEQMATEYALYKAKRMNRTIMLPEVNAFTIGQLLYMLEVETAFVAELLEHKRLRSTRSGRRQNSYLCPYGTARL